ncbi:MAG: prepilin-type N-terminal cleavage/methylation domain-containing protein [Gammaproteobacteria bacterium]|nr:prepilin-type N-terminal cleavage/methylation domain-containing protein [Gammaproteobacteria bacterium]
MTRYKKQAGITLIEMMIALILGLLVSSAIIAIFISNIKSSSENIRMIQLNQELRTVMNFMSDELKRAGYSANRQNSDFIKDYKPSIPNCILYSYDVDLNGLQTSDERFGFKLDAAVIKWINNRASATTYTTDCDAGTWQPLTDIDTANITAFTLIPTAVKTASSTLFVQNLEIELTGEISLNPGTASRTIVETIRVRNEDTD